jgi:hypothetical protein
MTKNAKEQQFVLLPSYLTFMRATQSNEEVTYLLLNRLLRQTETSPLRSSGSRLEINSTSKEL